ncbi:MAG: polysaccharide biosynthesis protein [Candidatus Frackibacter sp. T328-2]|nr:MAG: polysaccharide biosynthesis protein [Candidatus Frackibacter sp. T328-2]
MIKLKNIVVDKLFSNDARSAKIKKNIVYTFGLRFLAILASFLLIRVTYDFLNNKAIYGVWLTILSVLSWINYFDIGLGNGLRNKLAESISNDEKEKGKIYVSTAYAVIFVLVILLTLIYLIVFPFLNWNDIFNIELISQQQLKLLLKVVVILYLLKFLFSLINSISFASHDAMMPPLIQVITNYLVLFILLLLLKFGFSGIVVVGGVYSGVNAIIVFIASILLFLTRYRKIAPSFRFIRLEYVRDLFGLGIKFFILQIAALVIFTTDNIIITRVLGPEYVTSYQVVFKLFNVFNIIAGIILTPIWSAYTEAFTKKDYDWMRSTLKKLMFLMIFLVIGVSIMVLLSKKIILIWMGENLGISYLLITLMAVSIVIRVWSAIFANISNGINRIKVQLITSIIAGIINVPLSIYFAKNLGLGNSGVIIGTIISLSIFAIFGSIDIYRILFRRKSI